MAVASSWGHAHSTKKITSFLVQATSKEIYHLKIEWGDVATKCELEIASLNLRSNKFPTIFPFN